MENERREYGQPYKSVIVNNDDTYSIIDTINDTADRYFNRVFGTATTLQRSMLEESAAIERRRKERAFSLGQIVKSAGVHDYKLHGKIVDNTMRNIKDAVQDGRFRITEIAKYVELPEEMDKESKNIITDFTNAAMDTLKVDESEREALTAQQILAARDVYRKTAKEQGVNIMNTLNDFNYFLNNAPEDYDLEEGFEAYLNELGKKLKSLPSDEVISSIRSILGQLTIN